MGCIVLPMHVFAVSAPSAVDMYVLPGERESIEIPVRNDADSEKRMNFSLHHVSFGEDAVPVLGVKAADIPWIGIDEPFRTYTSREIQSVTVTVAPPSNIPAQSTVFALLSTEAQSDAFALTHGTATLLFVTIGAGTDGVLCDGFTRNADGTFSIALTNTGQGILYEEGNIHLRGPWGHSWVSTPSNPSRHRVVPGQTRTWTSEPLRAPWWAFGPFVYSLESEHISCPRITAGFGWLPIILVGTLGVAGVFAVRYRR